MDLIQDLYGRLPEVKSWRCSVLYHGKTARRRGSWAYVLQAQRGLRTPSVVAAMGGGILAKNIGDRSAHGRANERIMKGIVQWMEEHSDTITGLDPNLPLLPQLDRLSAEQLKEAFRSMDPMAS